MLDGKIVRIVSLSGTVDSQTEGNPFVTYGIDDDAKAQHLK
jgi:hypothetical protein